MKRIVNVEAGYKTKDIHRNLERFSDKFPEASAFCAFDKDCTIDDISKSLPITDKFLADGTVNNEWTYYFDIDFDFGDGIYIWFIQRS